MTTPRGRWQSQQIRGVNEVVNGNEILLDATSRHEADQQRPTACFVVGTRTTTTAKWLLSDDRTGALVIDIKVARRLGQQVSSGNDRLAVAGKEGTRQTILGRFGEEFAGFLELGVLVDIDSHDRAKDLLCHGLAVGVLGDNDGRLDEVAGRVIALAACNDLAVVVCVGVVDIALDLVKRKFVDHWPTKVVKGLWAALLDPGMFGEELLLKLSKVALGHVHATAGRTLLALELKRATDGLKRGMTHSGVVERAMQHVVVFTARFSHHTRVARVLVDVVTNLLPEMLEDLFAGMRKK